MRTDGPDSPSRCPDGVYASRCCQADELDVAVFGPANRPVPGCSAQGEAEIAGFVLCAGCVEALQALTGLGEQALLALGDLTLRESLRR